MSITITKESKHLYIVHIQGIYTYDDQKQIEEYGKAVDLQDKIKILILADQFSGWGKEGNWGDLTSFYESDPYIEKIAIVADDKWRDQFLMFHGAGRRQADVEFFLPDEVQDARDWLNEEVE